MHRQPKSLVAADGAEMRGGLCFCWPLFGSLLPLTGVTPCLLVRRHVRRKRFVSTPARSRTPMRSRFAVPPCALGFGTKDGSLAKALCALVCEIHCRDCHALGGTVRGLHCSHSYDTAMSSRIGWMDGRMYGYTAACSLADMYYHFACEIKVATVCFRPTA